MSNFWKDGKELIIHRLVIGIIVGFAVAGALVGWRAGDSRIYENFLQSTTGKVRNHGVPGQQLIVDWNTPPLPACDTSITSYAVGEKDVYPIGTVRHPRAFMELTANQTDNYQGSYLLPATIMPGEYHLMVFVEQQCTALQRLAPNAVQLQPVMFTVK